MKKTLVAILSLLVATLLVLTALFIVPPLKNVYDAKKLVKVIQSENIMEIKSLLEKNLSCANTYPTLIPRWMQMVYRYYPLTEACAVGNLEIVMLLVDSGADVNVGKWHTPLSLTYTNKPNNWYEISTYLISKGAALDYSVGNSHSAGVLVDIVGPRIGQYYEYGEADLAQVEAAFYYAIEHCDHSKVQWMRVLQHSISYGRIGIVKSLLDEGYCDVNDNSVGMTALMFAARDSTVEMADLLLSYGADKTIVDEDGKTAYDYAVEKGYTDLAELIKP